MTVKVTGQEDLKKNLASLDKLFGKEIRSALIAGGKLVETEAKKSIQTMSMGDRVIRTRNGGGEYEHITSRPGDAPNTDTGLLVKSIVTEVAPAGVFVGTNTEYAPWLEFGTSNMKARPFLYPALQSKRKVIIELVGSAMRKSINASAD